MSLQSDARPATAHVIVLGNEKGGCGKSTTAMHVAVALLDAGQRVATIDLDFRQQSLTHYVQYRRAWANRARLDLRVPTHFCVAGGSTLRIDENETIEFAGFAQAVASVEETHDFIVVDTPGSDSYLTRLAHCMADTLITPLNDSFVDFDVLGTIEPDSFTVLRESHYAAMVRDARRQRRAVDGVRIDWVVVRNRLSIADTRNKRRVGEGLRQLAAQVGFRSIEGLAERVVYRELFPCGLTALDAVDAAALDARPSLAHLTARQEVMTLIEALKLPVNERGRRRAAARAEWSSAQRQPLQLDDVLEDAIDGAGDGPRDGALDGPAGA
jgi:chromosome partitioning protein